MIAPDLQLTLLSYSTPLDQAAVERYVSQHIPAFQLASVHQFSFGQS